MLACCPNCKIRFHLLLFVYNKRVESTFSSVTFICNNCQEIIRAETTYEYRRNRILLLFTASIGILAAALIAVPFPKTYQFIVWITTYALLNTLAIIRGHHLMRFALEKTENK